MYIEEAIKELKSEVNDSKECRYIDLVGDECVEFFQLIETLLTAYEKEKEKNKNVRDYIYDLLNNDDIINIGIDDIKIILDMLEE